MLLRTTGSQFISLTSIALSFLIGFKIFFVCFLTDKVALETTAASVRLCLKGSFFPSNVTWGQSKAVATRLPEPHPLAGSPCSARQHLANRSPPLHCMNLISERQSLLQGGQAGNGRERELVLSPPSARRGGWRDSDEVTSVPQFSHFGELCNIAF